MPATCQQLFQLLADETRLRCVVLLRREGELCVCELMHAIGESQPKVSRHLATLRDAELVSDRRVGQWVFYRLADNLPQWVKEIVTITVAQASTAKPGRDDLGRLRRMNNRPGVARCA